MKGSEVNPLTVAEFEQEEDRENGVEKRELGRGLYPQISRLHRLRHAGGWISNLCNR
jgi:hypothetical protein